MRAAAVALACLAAHVLQLDASRLVGRSAMRPMPGRSARSNARAGPSAQGKRVCFSALGKAVATIDDHAVEAPKALDDYMTLPADQWVELDARVITKLPATSADVQHYEFRLPLRITADIVAVTTCTVDVRVNAEKRELRITGRNATVRVLDDDPQTPVPGGQTQPRSDATETVVFGDDDFNDENANVTNPEVSRSQMTEVLGEAQLQVDFTAIAQWRPATRGPVGARTWGFGGSSSNGTIELSTETSVAITLPSAIMRVPAFVLEGSGKMILRIVTSAILPEFGKLVAADYRAWSRGLDRTGGALLRTMQADSALRSSPMPPTDSGDQLPTVSDSEADSRTLATEI
ncbi:hypothetical protein T492DRAFT_1063571 [Pavlovales sp. CCMP2436]|nr:hypothetical protein T492DRAFT_1063571 [Pavlovales sp. CCMP2436]|mmetsp:Transcript_16469/g.39167  ORF Transcript_16469/g.39167 Transcript_16469/m.39167 type:complete len:347 (+) Transcript_16469:71-1111(+)